MLYGGREREVTYHLLALGAALVLMIDGAGKASLDRAFSADRDTVTVPARAAAY